MLNTKNRITRKQFLTQSAATAGSLLAIPSLLSAAAVKSANEKLGVATIGAGGLASHKSKNGSTRD